MREALKEAALGEGGTRPNPPVGCLIVKEGEVIARGHHQFAGGPHAEVSALASLNGADVTDATLYVTLEPCSTYGRTPPCTDAIIQSGIKRVVVALSDVNPKHAGRGLNLLWKAGIDVVTEVCWQESLDMLRPFFKLVTQKKPYVSLKMAQSFDGGIADHAGQSKWISSAESRAHVRELRKKADIVIVGCGTVVADDPSLLRDGSGDVQGIAWNARRAGFHRSCATTFTNIYRRACIADALCDDGRLFGSTPRCGG